MNKVHSVLMVVLTGLALLAISPDDAFAKRLGGGKSFGSRPSYSESYRPGPDASPTYRAPQSASQPSALRNQAMRDTFRSRGGLMGMLGGLALGGLLGAMLFGGGFEHINLFDIVILGLAAYLLYRVFAARRRSQWGPLGAGASRSGYPSTAGQSDRLPPQHREDARSAGSARFDTNVLFRDGGSRGAANAAGTAASGSPKPLPAGFDADAFLAGAKNAYTHLQAAWDEGDLAELRSLTTKPVFDELNQQLHQRSGPERTHVVSLDVKLLEVLEQGSSTQATVRFDAMVQDTADGIPTQACEVWHFVRDNDSRQPTWFLDGIQQIDA